MDAVVAAVSAIAAFSDPVQERLGSFVPNFAGENGRSMTGMLVTGLVVALMYFFARRYVIKA
jgi:ABC-type glycerol-3-phosphate transport system permease component